MGELTDWHMERRKGGAKEGRKGEERKKEIEE